MLCLRGFNAEIKEPSSIIKKRWPGLLYFSMNYLKLWRVLVLSPLRSSLKLILHLHGLVSSSLPKEINHKLYCELSKKHLLEIYACGNNKQGCFGCVVLGTDFFCRLTVCNLVSQKCTIFFTFYCFVLLRVCFGFENCLLLKPCVVSLDYKN